MDNPIDAQNLEETIKKFDSVMEDLNKNSSKAFDELKETQESINYNDTLIEKIINNALMITKSPQVLATIDTLKTKIDDETLIAILNLVVYTSSAACHQAILFYDELLRQKLLTDFNKVEEFVANSSINNTVALEQIKILNIRLNEVRQKLQIDDITK